MARKHTSIETRHVEERDSFYQDLMRLSQLSRRHFFRISAISAGIAAAKNLVTPASFQLINVAGASEAEAPRLRIAYISDAHLDKRELNDRFIRSIIKAVDDVNALDPQPDFVLFGGDLAQLGQREELDIGHQILRGVRAPLRMVVGEHDWFLDMGEHWQALFGAPQYAFDVKGVHFVTLMSVNEKDFWTARNLSPTERMEVVAGLDNGLQSRFEVGEAGRAWLAADLAKVDKKTPLVVFSHAPLYKYYRDWNFWTEDADEVQALLSGFDNVTVVHGHTHQVLSNRIGNISFHGMLSTAWPWPYAPEGLPALTVQTDRSDPFNAFDGCGDGRLDVLAQGCVDKLYNLWNRNPTSVPASSLRALGRHHPRPGRTDLPSC